MQIQPREIPFPPPPHASRSTPLLLSSLLIALCAGCSTLPSENSATSCHLRSIPSIPPSSLRPDQALVSAFFAANGIRLTTDQLHDILPNPSTPGQLDRHATRRIAKEHHRLLASVKADERFLWDELAANQPLLLFLPADLHYHPEATPVIPVAWDRHSRTIDLLDGSGQIRSIPEATFFELREPLRHAALRLVKPSSLRASEPPREQLLLLADFWYDQSFYRRTEPVFTAIQQDIPAASEDLGALLERGNALIRKNRYADAIPVFQQALALDPDNAKILNNLAYCMLHGDGELMTALRHVNRAVELDPHNPLVLETAGSINLRLGDAPAATRHLQQAWARALRRSPEVQIAIMDQLVRAWLAADREDLAWQVAQHRHRSFPDYRIPQDILFNFPALNRPAQALASAI